MIHACLAECTARYSRRPGRLEFGRKSTLTETERALFIQVHQRQLTGYQRAEQLRLIRLRETSTVEAICTLRRAFRLAAHSQPLRETSGLVDYYAALCKSR